MNEENNTNTMNTEQHSQEQATNAAPAATGEQAETGKTFTQEEVNRIVSERLTRERAKTENPLDSREQELTKRENKLKCIDFLSENEKYPKELTEFLDTSDLEAFKAKADKLLEVFPELNRTIPRFVPQFTAPATGSLPSSGKESLIARAFGLNK